MSHFLQHGIGFQVLVGPPANQVYSHGPEFRIGEMDSLGDGCGTVIDEQDGTECSHLLDTVRHTLKTFQGLDRKSVV